MRHRGTSLVKPHPADTTEAAPAAQTLCQLPLKAIWWAAAGLALAYAPITAQAQDAATVPPVSPPVLTPLEQVEARFRRADNVVEFANRRALGRFFLNWDQADFRSPSIAHFGDSHVQFGWMIAPLRDRLQRAKGNGGRGLIFPYALARTYSQEDYVSSFTGIWQSANSIQQPPKLPVGVSGFVGITKDPIASVTIDFTKPQTTDPVDIRVYVKVADVPYNIRVDTGAESQSYKVTPMAGAAVQSLIFPVARLSPKLTVTFERDAPEAPSAPLPAAPAPAATPLPAPPIPGQMSLYGIDIRSQRGGLVYHNLGVGGANYNAILQQRLFAEQYRLVRPDLVILDWGTNDIIYKNAIPADHEQKVLRTIQKIRAIDPQVTILLTSVQNMSYKGRNITVAADYARLMRRIAIAQDCLFFDWFLTSGGADTMPLWSAAKLASRDKIHLNGRGYRRRGEAMADAILATLEALRRDPGLRALIRDIPSQSLEGSAASVTP